MDIIYRYDPYEPMARHSHADAESAIKCLKDGNDRFASIVAQVQREVFGNSPGETLVIPANPLSLGFALGSGAAQVQAPYALVLGCSDARVPIERIFDQTSNELFVIRIAGNVLGIECLGSIHYAVRNLGGSLRLLAVVGHSGCGAVTAAVDSYLNPEDYSGIAFTHALRSLVDQIQMAVRGAAKALERVLGPDVVNHPGYRTALLDVAVYLNAALAAFDLRRELQASEEHQPPVVYGVFDLVTQRVRAVPDGNIDEASHDPAPFADAPEGPGELIELGIRLAKSVVARGMLS